MCCRIPEEVVAEPDEVGLVALLALVGALVTVPLATDLAVAGLLLVILHALGALGGVLATAVGTGVLGGHRYLNFLLCGRLSDTAIYPIFAFLSRVATCKFIKISTNHFILQKTRPFGRVR